MFPRRISILFLAGLLLAFHQVSIESASLRADASARAAAEILGKNSLYANLARSLKEDAPAKVIVTKMDELQAVLTTRMEHVKEGCELDTKHFFQRLITVQANLTKVNRSLVEAKRCVKQEIEREEALGEDITKALKAVVPQRKFDSEKLKLKQIRRRAKKLMDAHSMRHDRYQKELVMFKEQDKILSHVMGTIESYYKKKSVNKEATQTSAQEVLLEIGAKSKAHHEVVAKLMDLMQSNKGDGKEGTEEKPVVTKRMISTAPAPKKGKVLAGTIYEAITELKGTFMNEQRIRTQRYETRKDEHVQELEQLRKEEDQIKLDVTGFISNNKNVTEGVNGLKQQLNKAMDRQRECKQRSVDLAADVEKLAKRKATRKFALNHTRVLCKEQLKDILKEIKLSNYISGLIQKRVKKIQQALQQFEKNSGEDATGTGSTGSTGATGNSNSNAGKKLEEQIKSSEDCATMGVSFWCKSEENMKQCGVTKADCERMKAGTVAEDLTDSSATGNAAADSENSIRKRRYQPQMGGGRGTTGGTGPQWTATGNNGDKLKNAASETGASTGAAPSSTGGSNDNVKPISKTKKQTEFEKLLKVFDQNKDQRIGWDEIIAVTKHEDPRMKREFQAAAGNDMKMDYKEFHKFMNGSKKSFFFF